ncbi:MAG: glycosyltransferase family 4 protein [Patescibacteria group bacterium]
MKIAQVVCAWPPYAGGIAGSAYQIGQLLSAQHTVTNFTPTTLKPWLQYGHGAFLPQLLWRLRSFDYIYLHYPFFGTAEIIWLFKLLGGHPKLIIHYHMDVKNLGWLAQILSWPSRCLRTSLLNQATLIVTASLDYVKNSQIKKYQAQHPEKFREIPFGLDLDKFRAKTLNRPTDNLIIAKAQEIIHYINDRFIKKDRRGLLFVGGLDRAHYFKGLPILLRALAGVTTRSWRLTIIGTGDRQTEYKDLAAALGLSGRVNFAGKVSEDDLIRAYQNADLLILPSINTNEAFGIVLIEALACGVPVIASDLPGVRRVFTDHQEGLLAQPDDVADLRKKLEFILKNESLRQTMSLAARRLAMAKYDIKTMKKKLEELFL